MNNPPVAYCDIPENTFWYNITTLNVTRVFKIAKKWYYPSNRKRALQLEELTWGDAVTEIAAEDFIEQTQKNKLIYIPDLDRFYNQQNQ
jgi:hypothetical protein